VSVSVSECVCVCVCVCDTFSHYVCTHITNYDTGVPVCEYVYEICAQLHLYYIHTAPVCIYKNIQKTYIIHTHTRL
jgi:hypothetical protein